VRPCHPASCPHLWETGILRREEQARFHTRSGLLTAVSRGGEIELNFPAKTEEPAEAPDGLSGSLKLKAKYIGKSKFDYLVQVDSEKPSAAEA